MSKTSILHNSAIEKKSTAPKPYPIFLFLFSLVVLFPLWLNVFLPITIFWVILEFLYYKKYPKPTFPDYKPVTNHRFPIIPRAQRKYDVVVFGASGYTGGLLVNHLAKAYGSKRLKWAISGRSEEKIKTVKNKLVGKYPEMKDLDCIVADTEKFGFLESIVNDTKVVISTVGPYCKHGSHLVNACALYGTDHFDITGEIDWVSEMTNKFSSMAKKSGARIVSFCGADSIPWDVSVALINDEMKRNGSQLQKVDFFNECLTEPSGGTIATIFEIFARMKYGPKIQDSILANAFASKDKNSWVPHYCQRTKSWAGFFIMALTNFKVIARSNAILKYSDGFMYGEKELHPSLMVAFIKNVEMLYLFCVIVCTPLGWLVRKLV